VALGGFVGLLINEAERLPVACKNYTRFRTGSSLFVGELFVSIPRRQKLLWRVNYNAIATYLRKWLGDYGVEPALGICGPRSSDSRHGATGGFE
jgi:hypothetical protein